MKNSKLVFFFVASLLLLLIPFQAMCQEAAPTGLFQNIKGWLMSQGTGLIFGIVSGILAKHGWTLIIKKIAKKTAEVSVALEDFFGDVGSFAGKVDNAIKENGTIDQNSIQEVLAAGKEVIAEGKDVIISIKPKPVTP